MKTIEGADPHLMRSNDVTGAQWPVRHRQRPERPDDLQIMEIRAQARQQFATNGTILAARSTARQSAQDKANRRHGTSQAPARTSLRRRWGAFLLQTARSGLTIAQARSLRRRSTEVELIELTDYEFKMIGFKL